MFLTFYSTPKFIVLSNGMIRIFKKALSFLGESFLAFWGRFLVLQQGLKALEIALDQALSKFFDQLFSSFFLYIARKRVIFAKNGAKKIVFI